MASTIQSLSNARDARRRSNMADSSEENFLMAETQSYTASNVKWEASGSKYDIKKNHRHINRIDNDESIQNRQSLGLCSKHVSQQYIQYFKENTGTVKIITQFYFLRPVLFLVLLLRGFL